MKNFTNYLLLSALILTIAFSGCHKKDNVTPDTPTAQRAGLYVLNQGGFGHNNGSLTYYDYTSLKLTADIFTSANAKGLGDTPNDMKIYGSKMYVVVNVSSVIQVLDPKTAKIIKTISMVNGTANRQPRSIVFNANKAFISEYDGTVAVLDTTTLTIDKYITVGANPEQMVIANGKLYVANSGGLQTTPANTVSVVDLTALTETKKITVLTEPVSMAADASGNVYAVCVGDYTGAGAGLSVISSATDAVTSQNTKLLGNYGTSFIINGNLAYLLTVNSSYVTTPSVYNLSTQTITNFITDGTSITTPYAITYDSLTGELFVSDAKDYASNGLVYAFDKTGKKEYAITVGINPGAFAFINK